MDENDARIGEGTIIERGVTVGFRYHPQSGPAVVGKNGILRMGTIVYGDVTIGDYFQTGHYAVIRARVQIGDYCTILNHSTLEGLILMGSGVRIMSHVYIPSRTRFGDNIFVGPGVTFLNDRQPGRVETPETPRGATVEDDVMIGGGCTIMAGITIGQRSFIAAGAMVTRDVPPRSLVMGIPGRIQPLPEKFDMPNHRGLTQQPLDLWHPSGPDPRTIPWPW